MRFGRFASPDETDMRTSLYAAYDRLPAPVRAALRECPWDIHVRIRVNPDMDCTALIERIRAVRSEAEARDFNQQYAR